MSDQLLTVLKICFLALLYLFLLRVVQVVVRELRADRLLAPEPRPEPAAPPPPPERPRKGRRGGQLTIVEPPQHRGEAFPLDDEVSVGRARGCGVVLSDDGYVSQVHARVFRRDGDTFVEDLGSTNGTFVNGERITSPTRLRRGDRVQFGHTVVEVSR